MLGGHLLKSWASTQQVIATSSGEAELYAMIKCASQVIGMISMALDFGDRVTGEVSCDANAAIGIAHRQGLGKLRHINVQWLWIQERVRMKDIALGKVAGPENPADAMTKFLAKDDLQKHLTNMNCYIVEGRANNTLKLAMISNNGNMNNKWSKFNKSVRADPLGVKPDINNIKVRGRRGMEHPASGGEVMIPPLIGGELMIPPLGDEGQEAVQLVDRGKVNNGKEVVYLSLIHI